MDSDHYWDAIDSKLQSAETALRKMAANINPPERYPDAAAVQSTGTITINPRWTQTSFPHIRILDGLPQHP